MTHTHTKVQVQRPVGSKDRVETNGQTDRQTDTKPTDLPRRLTSDPQSEKCYTALVYTAAIRQHAWYGPIM